MNERKVRKENGGIREEMGDEGKKKTEEEKMQRRKNLIKEEKRDRQK